MRQSLPLGRFAGIPVGVNWSALVTLLVVAQLLAASALPGAARHEPDALYWVVGAVAAAAFLASLLAHELAHALVARRHGVAVTSVTLWALGGVTQLDGDADSPAADLRIALAGPAASLAAGAVFLGAAAAVSAAGGPRIVTAAAAWLAVMNGVLGVFNLLPGAPLDGGRVLRAALWRHWGDRQRAERAAAIAGRVLGTVLAVLGTAQALLTRNLISGLWLIVLGWFIAGAARAEQETARAKALLTGVRVADVMDPDPQVAGGWMTAADLARQMRSPSGQAAVPVLRPDGELAGLVTVRQLTRIPASRRAQLRLSDLALPVPPEYLAAPADPVLSLITRPPLGGEVLAVVTEDSRITGLVTRAQIERALRSRSLAGAGRQQPVNL